MRRLPWDILLALLAGLGLGLVYSWIIHPRGATNTQPTTLRADFKDGYRSVIAAAYEATGNLPRAQARLALLGDSNSIEALDAQAQRMQASGNQFEHADQVAALALALKGGSDNHASVSLSTSTLEVVNQSDSTSIATLPPPPPDLPIVLTETPVTPVTPEAQSTIIVPTPRPTQTIIPTLGAPFKLTGQESVCDPNLPDALLQVIVLNSNRRQLAGVGIVITWDGGEEQFFTGLKPELGDGYADYIMTPDVNYIVKLARGSDIALDILAPTCQAPSGENYLGSIKLTFQQP